MLREKAKATSKSCKGKNSCIQDFGEISAASLAYLRRLSPDCYSPVEISN